MTCSNRQITRELRAPARIAAVYSRRLVTLCLILAATAMLSPAQDERPSGNTVTFTDLFNFDLTNGANPWGPLAQGRDGNLYGVADFGGTGAYCVFGANQCGTVFSITPTGSLTTIYDFCSETNCTDGAAPVSGLALGTDGDFYGITGFAGTGAYCPNSFGCGTLFKVTPSGVLTTLHDWCSQPNCSDGEYQTFGQNQDTLIQATDGDFYGATIGGGATSFCTGCGTIFWGEPLG